MQNGKTHFEQIPVATVKEIAELLPTEPERIDVDNVEPQDNESQGLFCGSFVSASRKRSKDKDIGQ
jgi:hypothetical protein